MSFFDFNPLGLPGKAQYFFNVLVICIGIQPGQQIFPDQVIDIWYLDQLTAARPYVVHLYEDEGLDKDIDWQYECFPHSVVEIDEQFGPSFYDMLDFNTEDPWRIE